MTIEDSGNGKFSLFAASFWWSKLQLSQRNRVASISIHEIR